VEDQHGVLEAFEPGSEIFGGHRTASVSALLDPLPDQPAGPHVL